MEDARGEETEKDTDVDAGGNGVGSGEEGGEVVIRVLVVDDSSLDRSVVGQLLNKCAVNYEVISVDSGKRALEVLGLTEEKAGSCHTNVTYLETGSSLSSELTFAQKGLHGSLLIRFGEQFFLFFRIFRGQKIDLILTDYYMPEITGYDLLKSVKDHSITRSIPVVIMSSEFNPEKIARCKATGAEDFLLKPLGLEQVEKLRDYVNPTSSSNSPPIPKQRHRRNISVDLNAMISSQKEASAPR